MSNKQFISNLSATYADVRKLDVKKINLKGKNILEYIKENKTVILDERGTKADDTLDIWNSYVTKDENGNVIINRDAKPFEHNYNDIAGTIRHTTIRSAVLIKDNKVIDANNNVLMYWQTDGLTDGLYVCVQNTNLTTFDSCLNSLQSAEYMFAGCENLEYVSSNLETVKNGEGMFQNCKKLINFDFMFSSLTKGNYLFDGCELDAQSVANIIHFIPQRDTKPTSDYANGNITIGIGITNTDAAKQAFAEECDCDTWAELNKEFDDKNWAVEWQFNGSASYSLRDPRPSTEVYTKLEEVFLPTEEEIAAAKESGEHIRIPSYQYVSQDGDNYYNIHWYHDSNTDNEGYDHFESLEMATLAYGVIPKE